MNRRILPSAFLQVLIILTVLSAADVPASTPEPGTGQISAVPGEGWNLSITGHWSDGPAAAVVSLGDTVLAGEGATLVVLDMRTSVLPHEISRLRLPSVPRSIDIAGHYAYVAADKAGIQVVDISDVGNLSVVGVYETNWAIGIRVIDGYAYLANGGHGLTIVDVSDPQNPAFVGQLGLSGSGRDVDVEGNIACVAGSSGGLFVVDVTDVSSPALHGSYDTPGNATDVDIDGTLAYVADYQQGLRVIDISTPSAPAEVGFLDFYTEARRVCVIGPYAYVGTSNFNVVDVSTPSAPSLLGTCWPGGPTDGLWMDGTTAFLAVSWGGVTRCDAATPAAPAVQNQWDFAPGETHVVAVDGDHAYLGCEWEGMNVLDISDPSAPDIVGAYWVGPGYQMTDVTIIADTAYTTWSDGFRIIDVTDPGAPAEVGHYDSGYFEELRVDGDYAYIAHKSGGFRILDISAPASPVEVGHYPSPGYVYGVDYMDGYAYLAAAPEGLRIVDVSTPSAPVEVGYYGTQGWAYAVVVDSIYAYLGDTATGLLVIDVSNPAAPVEIGSFEVGFDLFDVVQSGDYLFLGHSEYGVSAVYVDDRTNPVLVGTFEDGDRADRLFAVGNSVYVADNEAGLYILEFDPPPTPTYISAFSAHGSDGAVELAWAVHTDDVIHGFRLYRTPEGSHRREPVNYGNLIAPDVRRFVDTTGRTGVSYEYVLAVVLVDGTEILSIPSVACACGLAVRLYPGHPNPFNPATTISFELPGRTRVQVAIFDARGARVRTLVDGPLDGGRRSVDWDGRDDLGNPVGSGVYFCRLVAGKKTFTQKLTLVK